MRVQDPGAHWEGIYESTALTDASWYEREPGTSLRLIEQFASLVSAGKIDIGSGGSLLVDRLLALGFTDFAVLDVSQRALMQYARVGETARNVTFLHQDVLTWKPDRQYDIWHDRAVFHFLTERAARDRYVETAACALGVVAVSWSRPSRRTDRRTVQDCPLSGTRHRSSSRCSRRRSPLLNRSARSTSLRVASSNRSRGRCPDACEALTAGGQSLRRSANSR